MSLIGTLHLGFGPSGSAGPAPATPQLSVVDLQDGRAEVVITDSSPDSVNNIRTLAVGTEVDNPDWIQQASQTGDGSTIITLGAGYYWFQTVSRLNGQSTVSDVVYAVVSTGTTSILSQCLTAVAARIGSLNLAGIAGDQVVIAKTAYAAHIEYPAIVVTPWSQESIDANRGTNLRDEVDYPVLVSILAADNRDQRANFDQYLLWRETIRRAFQGQRLAGVTQVLTAIVDPQEIVDQRAWFEHNLFHSSLLIRCSAYETH